VIRSVAVFCGSRFGNDPAFAAAATALGAGLAQSGRRLIYGGGRVGLMGLVADAALDAGGEVLGVIPEFLTHMEVAHHRLRDLVVTETMHDRKRRIYDEADAFVALPGGIGTMDELIEVITWRQLRQHDKPVLICDIKGSAAPLLAAIEATIDNGFSGADIRGLFELTQGVAATLARLDALPAGRDSGVAHL
jgi:uncharacterized protein (TIGR00730 family)